jgi:DNA invertase Pin-like site-specific DNA recombinase
MVRQTVRSGKRNRLGTKAEVLAGGNAVAALTYERASQDAKGQGKSVGDQRKLNLAEVARYGWRAAGSYKDNDRSASRHAHKEREEFPLLMDAIRAGKGDVLVVWEISRSQRDLAIYVQIRDLCVQVGMYFWMVGGVLYDLRDKNDRMMLGFQAVQAEWMADSIRDNTLRGIEGAAEAGRPHGKITYGYRRIYHPRTRAFERQEPDTETREATAEDGTVTKYTRVEVVREIFDKVASGIPLIVIERQLNDRGIPSPRGSVWRRGIIRKMAMNPAYIAKRVLRGEIVSDAVWPALVDEETYWACVRLLEDPSRLTTKPARAVYLLSYIARCGVCGDHLQGNRTTPWRGIQKVYTCAARRCVTVMMDALDELTERTVVAWLSRPDVFESLSGGQDDEAVIHARAEAQRLRAELEDYRKAASTGDIKAMDWIRISRGLESQIEAQEKIASEASVPPVLRGRIGPEAVKTWAALDDDVAVKRDIIRTIADIIVNASPSGTLAFGPDLVTWRWKLGPQKGDEV